MIFSACIMVICAQEPKCTDGGYQIIPKLDCTGYYLCVYGNPVEMPNCPPGSVFSTSAHVCVPENSIYDDCKKGTVTVEPVIPVIPDAGPLSIEEQCKLYGGIIPHPSECQAFYNCSLIYEYVPRFYEQHLQECEYPKLFNIDTKQCKHFENVKCVNRKEYKNACDYRRNQCAYSHCIPCNVRYSNCEGLSDGQHAHLVKTWSPYYVMCYRERMISEHTCQHDQNGRTQLFHPELNECVSLDRIPQEHGGMMPDCSDKPDGFYLDDFGRCDQYNYCKGGKFVNSVKCKDGEVFDSTYGDCIQAEKACGPCGKRDDC